MKRNFASGRITPLVSPISDLDDIYMTLWTLDFRVDGMTFGAVGMEWIYFAYKKDMNSETECLCPRQIHMVKP